MDANDFYKMLDEKNVEHIFEILKGYAGSEGPIGRMLELYEEAASYADMTVEDYLSNVSPNEYVEWRYGMFLEKE